jgi:hypothetical protein
MTLMTSLSTPSSLPSSSAMLRTTGRDDVQHPVGGEFGW